MKLSDEHRHDWKQQGWVQLAAAIEPTVVAQLVVWEAEVEAWSTSVGPGLHHFEQTSHGPALARSERFADHHEDLDSFLRGGVVAHVLAQLFGEPAVLFKEKVNYKHPGGAGFAPHQDATAYRFVDHHISVMVPLDSATVASGCLYFAPGYERGQMPVDDRGRIAETVAATLDWRAIEVEPGDLVFFDSYAPHYSDTNTSAASRRALYLTYNAASRGDFRVAYYEDKEAEFAREGDTFGDERVRISISDDFLGKPIEAPHGT